MIRTELEFLGVKIPKKLKKELTEAIQRGDYVSQSDLTRTALRNLLDQGKEI